jgi:hypothetical protein
MEGEAGTDHVIADARAPQSGRSSSDLGQNMMNPYDVLALRALCRGEALVPIHE